MNTQVPNLEEAANVAAEFIYSIDNLPHEVSHILQEIKHRETRTQELQQEIDKDSVKYIRGSRRASSVAGTPPSPSSSRAPSPKLLSIPAKVAASYAEIQELAQEKCVLASRLIEIITRTRAKLDIDITKVRTLQGDSPEVIAAAAAAAAASKPLAGLVSLSADSFGAPGRNPALAISESLRNALSIPTTPDTRAAAAAVHLAAAPSPTPPPTKKRRITSSIKLSSPAPSPIKGRSASPTTSAPPPSAHVQTKSRLSRQLQIPVEEESPEAEADGEASDYLEMEEEAEDERLYCFCQKQSYGDMIACDNESGCPYEWFHLSCVGVKQPVPKVWYCSVCTKNKAAAQPAVPTRKGRKK